MRAGCELLACFGVEWQRGSRFASGSAKIRVARPRELFRFAVVDFDVLERRAAAIVAAVSIASINLRRVCMTRSAGPSGERIGAAAMRLSVRTLDRRSARGSMELVGFGATGSIRMRSTFFRSFPTALPCLADYL